jgi:hypothetical protein
MGANPTNAQAKMDRQARAQGRSSAIADAIAPAVAAPAAVGGDDVAAALAQLNDTVSQGINAILASLENQSRILVCLWIFPAFPLPITLV